MQELDARQTLRRASLGRIWRDLRPMVPPVAGFGRLHRELRASATSIGSWTSEIRNFTILRLVRRNRCAGDLVSLARPKQAYRCRQNATFLAVTCRACSPDAW